MNAEQIATDVEKALTDAFHDTSAVMTTMNDIIGLIAVTVMHITSWFQRRLPAQL